MAAWQVPFPSWKVVVLQNLLFISFEDFSHYWGMCFLINISDFGLDVMSPFSLCNSAHQAFHTGLLYKYIHKIHHKYSAPFGLAVEYAHPAEVLILGTGTIAGPILYTAFARDLHIFSVYIWIVLRLFQAVDAHSGYGRFIALDQLNQVPMINGHGHSDRFPMVTPTHSPFLVWR